MRSVVRSETALVVRILMCYLTYLLVRVLTILLLTRRYQICAVSGLAYIETISTVILIN